MSRPSQSPKRPPKRISEGYLRNAGLAYLERFPCSVGRFRVVMGRKIRRSLAAHPDQDADACAALLEGIIRVFSEAGYLNDSAYALGMARSLRGRGMARSALVWKLREKGLGGDQIEEALSRLEIEAEETGIRAEEADLIAALRVLRRKRAGPFAAAGTDARDPAAVRRAMGALARAGFDAETARRAVFFSPEEAAERLG